MPARPLGGRAERVIGIDLDEPSLALARAAGGVLAAVGLARNVSLLDHAHGVVGLVASWILRIGKGGYWQHPSPIVLPPPDLALLAGLDQARLA